MGSTWQQRLVGLFLLAIGPALTAWAWFTVLAEGSFNLLAAGCGPAFSILGLGAALCPIDKRGLLEKHGVAAPQNFGQLPPVWKGLVVGAAVAGVGNMALLWLR